MNEPRSRVVVFIVHGAPVQIVMYESAAKEILHKWMTSEYSLSGINTIGDENCEGPWAIRVDAIASIQIGQEVDLFALKARQTAQTGGPNPKDMAPGFGSGLPAYLRKG